MFHCGYKTASRLYMRSFRGSYSYHVLHNQESGLLLRRHCALASEDYSFIIELPNFRPKTPFCPDSRCPVYRYQLMLCPSSRIRDPTYETLSVNICCFIGIHFALRIRSPGTPLKSRRSRPWRMWAWQSLDGSIISIQNRKKITSGCRDGTAARFVNDILFVLI